MPADFETEGPHRLVLQTRVRTVGLTTPWELELPHVPFTFEFDPRLEVDALFALPDEAGRVGRSPVRVRLAVREADRSDEGRRRRPSSSP